MFLSFGAEMEKIEKKSENQKEIRMRFVFVQVM